MAVPPSGDTPTGMGRYVKDKQLGEGTYGVVYKAWDKSVRLSPRGLVLLARERGAPGGV